MHPKDVDGRPWSNCSSGSTLFAQICLSEHLGSLWYSGLWNFCSGCIFKWTASSEFGTYCLCEQRRFRRACASAQSRQNLRCSLIQAVSQEEPSDRKPDPWSLSMAGHAQLKFLMTECSKTQIRLTRLKQVYLQWNSEGQKHQNKWDEPASSWDSGTYHIGDQQRHRRACASAQSCQSLRCSHTWSMQVDKGSDQKSDI